MKTFNVTSLDELTAVLKAEGQDALLRGQTQHYEENGAASFKTSFSREGCIPPKMLKWNHFASEVLNHWFADVELNDDISQAVLQHYGWRSFYLDATSRPAVAAWFASHSFKSNIGVQMCEDYEERPVLLRKMDAWYQAEGGTGHLYIIDKEAARKTVGTIDLSPFKLAEFRPRFMAQAAWLIGPLVRGPLPPECVRAHIIADRALLKAYAESDSLTDVNTLFPGVEEDPVLYSFLSLPWLEIKAVGENGGLRGFGRAMEFPEYQHEFEKRLSGTIALFGGERLTPDENDKDGRIMVVPTVAVVGSADPVATQFPHVTDLLKKHKGIAFEVDYLSRHPGQENTDLYGKGVYVRRYDDGLVELGELMVRHPGFDLTDAGNNVGWYYRIADDGTWNRVRHEKECNCGNDFIHFRHKSALTIIEAWLTEPWKDDAASG